MSPVIDQGISHLVPIEAPALSVRMGDAWMDDNTTVFLLFFYTEMNKRLLNNKLWSVCGQAAVYHEECVTSYFYTQRKTVLTVYCSNIWRETGTRTIGLEGYILFRELLFILFSVT